MRASKIPPFEKPRSHLVSQVCSSRTVSDIRSPQGGGSRADRGGGYLRCVRVRVRVCACTVLVWFCGLPFSGCIFNWVSWRVSLRHILEAHRKTKRRVYPQLQRRGTLMFNGDRFHLQPQHLVSWRQPLRVGLSSGKGSDYHFNLRLPSPFPSLWTPLTQFRLAPSRGARFHSASTLSIPASYQSYLIPLASYSTFPHPLLVFQITFGRFYSNHSRNNFTRQDVGNSGSFIGGLPHHSLPLPSFPIHMLHHNARHHSMHLGKSKSFQKKDSKEFDGLPPDSSRCYLCEYPHPLINRLLDTVLLLSGCWVQDEFSFL